MADYLKIPEVARRLDVSEPTVRRMVKSGRLPSVFIGGAYRVSETDLEEFLENAKVEPGKVEAPPPERTFDDVLEDERRIAIDYGACRTALEDFSDHWQPALSGERQLERQAFQDFKADATSLSRLTRELMGAEMAELGQQYDDEGDPVFYTEQSELGPAIIRFSELAIQMDRKWKEQFGEEADVSAEVIELREYAQRKAG